MGCFPELLSLSDLSSLFCFSGLPFSVFWPEIWVLPYLKLYTFHSYTPCSGSNNRKIERNGGLSYAVRTSSQGENIPFLKDLVLWATLSPLLLWDCLGFGRYKKMRKETNRKKTKTNEGFLPPPTPLPVQPLFPHSMKKPSSSSQSQTQRVSCGALTIHIVAGFYILDSVGLGWG